MLDYPPLAADLTMSTTCCILASGKLKYEEVLCPICREIFIEPVSLPCKHVMCLECLRRTLENNSLVCPICRTRIGTFIRLAKNLKKIIDEKLWRILKNDFPMEIQRKINGEEDGISNKILSEQQLPPVITKKGVIKEEFDEMFHKLKIEEEQSRKAALFASEMLAKKIMEEELEAEKLRRRKAEEIAKSDALYIKSLILSESSQKNNSSISQCSDMNDTSSSSSHGRDSISDELRHFTPICIAPKTPPKRLPNGKLDKTKIIRPINLVNSFNDSQQSISVRGVAKKMPLKISSNNFLRTKALTLVPNTSSTLTSRDDEEKMIIDNSNQEGSSSSDLNSNLTDSLPFDIIKQQELIQLRIKQEQEDRAIALKLQNKWNREKFLNKRKHGYQLRSAKKFKKFGPMMEA